MITKVIDLRTGACHPIRGWRGKFISRKNAAEQIRILDKNLRRRDLHPRFWIETAQVWKRWCG